MIYCQVTNFPAGTYGHDVSRFLRALTQRNKDSKLARLRDLLWGGAAEVGLEKLSQPQRHVSYAACLVADDEKLTHSEQVRHHHIVKAMARPTFCRALRDLVLEGYLVADGKSRNGRYKIVR